MNMDASDVGVYGEAKGEYTRQLCVFLVPALESYFLDLLTEAKQNAAGPSKELLTFQNMLQGIPDWNQDKVIRETGRIQNDSKCDYLEELLTAVFIAHTKVLSAIRLTSKQKKLQITIPKLDHFLHRVLSECARSLWSSAFLFAGANSIERQKNLRQVEHLIQEAVLQAIRGLLPVKSILREYLVEDEEEEEGEKPVEAAKPSEVGEPVANIAQAEEQKEGVTSEQEQAQTQPQEQLQEEEEEEEEEKEKEKEQKENITSLQEQPSNSDVPTELVQSPPVTSFTEAPILNLEGNTMRPSVQFNDKAMVFSESGLEEVDLIEEEPQMDSVDTIQISNEVLPMDEFEDLEKPATHSMRPREPSPIAFEELP